MRSTLRSARHARHAIPRPTCPRPAPTAIRYQSSTPPPKAKQPDNSGTSDKSKAGEPAPRKKTVAERDAELKSRLEAMSGDGGAAGVEYENGSAEGLKSEVKRNMFRLI